ncbi:MAG: amidohydrolase [Candidatus Marinimicrobia bacterium]|nr:amidohydrolase [Candidatus Neomarinimicrobiota bacterium]
MSQKVNLINGNFITLDAQCPNAEMISVVNGKIYGVNALDHNVESIDLKGATVIPGFTDAHFHLTNLGKQLDTLQLKECKSSLEVAEKVLKKSAELSENDWIIGFGWDHNKWQDPQFPNADILNSLPISQPIMLNRIDGHSCWVNQKAMELSGLNVSPNPPEGGDIINDCILLDNAMNPVQFIIPKPDEITVEKWINLALEIIAPRGITNIHDAWQDATTVKVLQKLSNAGKLPIRVYGMLGSSYPKLIKQFFNDGFYQSENYSIRSVKAFIDGALGSRGAALLEPYSDDHSNCGLILITHDEFEKLTIRCRDAGFQLCTHAIGDRGNRLVLDAYSRSVSDIKNHRWRIEHAQMVCDEDIPRFAENGIVPSMQPSHCTSDMPWLTERLGDKRLPRISRWKSFIDSGCQIPGGSDCPIEEGNPIFEYFSAVTRKDHKGLPNKGWQNQEIVTRLDALKMFTTWAAYGEFAEHRRGRIRPGFDADLTFLSQDITNCQENAILNTQVLGTMVAGNFLYNNLH